MLSREKNRGVCKVERSEEKTLKKGSRTVNGPCAALFGCDGRQFDILRSRHSYYFLFFSILQLLSIISLSPIILTTGYSCYHG